MSNLRLCFTVSAAAIVSACAANPDTESDFGNSVRYTVRMQTVASGPVDPNPVDEGDGERINGVLEAYRTDVARGDNAPSPVAIQFGGGTPQ